MKDLSKEIRGYALRNAIEFGSADAGRILPKLFQHGLDKKDIKVIMSDIQAIVKEVNALTPEERVSEFEKFKDHVVERKEEGERQLADLPDLQKNMVFRLAPFPSGALHLGNAKTYLLNALYAEMYKAKYGTKILLVMDDTIGSEDKQPIKEAYGLLQDAFDILEVKYEKPVVYKSDRIKLYYQYAEELIKKDKVYVCHCSQEVLRANREKGVECGCRQFPVKIQLLRWKEMFKAKEGDAVLRIKTSMSHPNPAFRDRVLFKISDRKHPRVGNKYRVWPTLEMSWAIDDHLLGVTHIIRGNDLMIETEMEKFIWDIFGWKYSTTIHTGLIRIEGMGEKFSKSKYQKEIQSGEFTGWEDPRTWSIQSLVRRGIKIEALRGFVREIGLNKQDVAIPIDALYSINRKLIDADAMRYYFVADPVQIEIPNKPKDVKFVGIPVHPDKKDTRKVLIKDIFISKQDHDSFAGQEVRLLHLFNLKLDAKEEKGEFTSIANKDIPKIQWVSDNVKCSILMPDGTKVMGIAESSIKKLKKGAMIQFERFGFVRFDGKNKDVYEFWFAHK